MKRGLQLFAALLIGFSATAQVRNGSVAMGPNYANQVYYKLDNQATNAYPHASWDIAFLRTSAFGFATRINDATGISVFEASANIADWATIDVAQEATWTRLYNSDTEWEVGAFDNASAEYGWGTYNMANHHVTGAIVFVLKYADGSFKKFKIDDFYGGYTFTYASWVAGAWTPDTTVTLANATNPGTIFNYYSLTANAPVVAEPVSADWDLMFTKYNTEVAMGPSTTVMYNVTGALTHPSAVVAENLEPDGVPNFTNVPFTEDINTVGYDWKTFNLGTGTYAIRTDKAFYIKNNGVVNRLVFESFIGASTGVITFNYEDVTTQLGIEDVNKNVSFGVYPNPAIDKKINVVYDVANATGNQNTISIYSLTGAKVFETKASNNAGFFNSEIDLSALNTGVYVLQFQSGDYTETKKIVLR